MALSREGFENEWRQSGESTTELMLGTAWRRYQQIDATRTNNNDPTLLELESSFIPALEAVKSTSSTYRIFHLPGNKPPWKATGMTIAQGQSVTVLATGRLWRSRILDLWLGPQFGLWYRLGPNGAVFNSSDATITFTATKTAELYLGTQFPGQYGDRNGRVQGNLSAYDKIEGSFEVVVIAWKHDAVETLERIVKMGDPFALASSELKRMERAKISSLPPDWQFLWFLGGNVGIIQKNIVYPLTPDTILSWKWLVSALPSRLREDTTVSHDYLSVVVEFENGRDLTYTWSWELPINFAYWCPLMTWVDREHHVVIRSGTSELGEWLDEERNVFADYVKYIGGTPPERILRVWLIAGSRWQRNKGEMAVKRIILNSKGQSLKVL